MKNKRIEIDTLGEYHVPENALYGSQTKRSYDTLKITNRSFSLDIIKNIIKLKICEANVNFKNKLMPQTTHKAITSACNKILNNFNDYKLHFITDEIQGGAGTSVNMNVNEVIANLASQSVGKELGSYYIHPNNDVNMGQSTNDIFPTAAKITFIEFIDKLLKKIEKLKNILLNSKDKFKNTIRVGKTHLQDAVPIKFSSMFLAWAYSLERDMTRFKNIRSHLLEINIGGTAIGTGVSQTKKNIRDLFKEVTNFFKYQFVEPISFIDSNRNVDVFVELSDVLKTFSLNLSKNCNDIRLLASGPSSGFSELILKEIQPGSSIMPGKVNPIIFESVNQIAFAVVGKNASINFAAESGQLELNVFEPIIFTSLIESFLWTTRACDLLIEYGVEQIQPNMKGIMNNIENSSFWSTLFIKKYGYEKVSKVIYRAHKNNFPVLHEIKKEFSLKDSDIKNILKNKNIFIVD